MRRIVVGVDGSEGSISALRWAIDEALLSADAVVETVLVWQLPRGLALPWTDPPVEAAIERAQHALDETVEGVLSGRKDVKVLREVVGGHPAETLAGYAADADLLVVGSRGRTELAEVLLGSVSRQCVEHARCPVAVIRPNLPAK